CARPRDYW
nr:immunoglobulin heavy chain junction region [Mus musculus]